MIRLTDEQIRELEQSGEAPIRVLDPQTDRRFVLVSESEFEQIREYLRDDHDQRALAAEAWRSMSRLLKNEPRCIGQVSDAGCEPS
jgi:PHD/YefM family antitoxin component YafN of YafNO toxin-antitoxin module